MGYATMGNSKKSAESYNLICGVRASRLRQEKRRVEARGGGRVQSQRIFSAPLKS